MTQEERKELLLKDLCTRLPYGVKVKFKVNEVIAIEEKVIYNVDGEYSYITDGKSYLTLDIIKAFFNNYLDEIKPYLFPLSSMTEEQYEEFRIKSGWDGEWEDIKQGKFSCIGYIGLDYLYDSIDWFNKNHFDYRDLIPMGLAIDAINKNIY